MIIISATRIKGRFTRIWITTGAFSCGLGDLPYYVLGHVRLFGYPVTLQEVQADIENNPDGTSIANDGWSGDWTYTTRTGRKIKYSNDYRLDFDFGAAGSVVFAGQIVRYALGADLGDAVMDLMVAQDSDEITVCLGVDGDAVVRIESGGKTVPLHIKNVDGDCAPITIHDVPGHALLRLYGA